jgi:aspartyl-tRNA synthetase
MEMSFVNEEDVFRVIEPLYARILAQVKSVVVHVPFRRLTYAEMMARYGTDRPDLRYGMELADLGEAFAGTRFRAIAAALSQGGVVKGFAAPGGSQLSRRELDELVQLTKERGAAGLVWMVVEKHITPEEAGAAAKATGAGPGDLMLIVADRADRTNVALDGLRRHLAARLGLVPDGEWRFCWMVEPPLFEWSEDERKWVSVHHPFTSPASDDLSPETATARAYDLVLNGFELGGGSIRIHDPDTQRRVFEVLGLTPEETEEKFGHLLRAFRYGVPPHGGIAMGLDRLAMLMAGKETLRDVTAFPKAQSGADPLTGAPTPVPEGPLRELGIKVIARPERRGGVTTPLSDWDLALLTGGNYGVLATLFEDGAPHATVTWVDAVGGHVLVNTAEGRRKDRNLRRDPRAAVTVVGEDFYQWASIQGSVVARVTGPEAEAHIDTLSRRYDGEPWTPVEGQVRVLYRIEPQRIIRYGQRR